MSVPESGGGKSGSEKVSRTDLTLLGSPDTTPRRPGSCFRPANAAPRSTSCNGTSACGLARHSAGSDDTCSDATCSSGDAGPRRTSLAGMNRTDEGTSGRPSFPDGEPADRAGSRLVSLIDHQRLRPVKWTQILDSSGGLYLLWSSPTQPRANAGSVDLPGCPMIECLMGAILVVEPEVGRQARHQLRNQFIVLECRHPPAAVERGLGAKAPRPLAGSTW